jgi:hypothetical protein
MLQHVLFLSSYKTKTNYYEVNIAVSIVSSVHPYKVTALRNSGVNRIPVRSKPNINITKRIVSLNFAATKTSVR